MALRGLGTLEDARGTADNVYCYEMLMQGQYDKVGGPDTWKGFTCTEYPYKSRASPPDCEMPCMACEEQFIPLILRWHPDLAHIEYHSDTEAESSIASLINSTKENHAYIREKIEEFGDTIAKRWKNRSKTKQTELIRRVRPDMYSRKDVGVEIQFKLARQNAVSARGSSSVQENFHAKYEDAYLLPYLNVEALTEDSTRLLALMHNRSHNDLEDWVLFDRLQLQREFSLSVFETAYNPHCVVAYGKKFGKLVQWEKEESHRGHMIGYPIARQIFKAQCKVSAFLREMVDQILANNLTTAVRGNRNWLSLQSTAFRDQDTLISPSGFRKQPFSHAPRFDVFVISNMIESRCRQAEDELVGMLTDPILLRDRLHPSNMAFNPKTWTEQDKLYSVTRILHHIYSRFIQWKLIKDLFEVFMSTRSRNEHAIQKGKKLPVEYDEALDCLEGCLRYHFNERLQSLSECSNSLPAYQHGSTRIGMRLAGQSVKPEDLFRNDKLVWGLNELLKLEASAITMTKSALVAFVDEKITEEKNRVNQSLYDRLADIAAMDEILRLIGYHPSREGALLSMNRDEVMFVDDRDLSRVFLKKLPKFYNKASPRLEPLREAIKAFLASPAPNTTQPSQHDLQLNLELHSALDHVWETFHALIDARLEHYKLSQSQIEWLVRSYDVALRQKEHSKVIDQEQHGISLGIERNDDYRQANCKKIISDTPDSSCNDQNCKQQAADQTDGFTPVLHNATGQLKSLTPASRTKIKSRPSELLSSTHSNDNYKGIWDLDKEDEATLTHTSITVSSSSMKVFSPMFSRITSKKVRVRWDDFVRAMVDAGFSATHGGGSAVAFEDKRSSKGTIVVHRPHPTSIVDLVPLRAIGKRLTRWFGWNEETFVDGKVR